MSARLAAVAAGQGVAGGRGEGALLRAVTVPGQPGADSDAHPAHEGGQDRPGAQEVLRGQRSAGHLPGAFLPGGPHVWIQSSLAFAIRVQPLLVRAPLIGACGIT